MSITPRDLLSLSDVLLQHPDEVWIRASASRAYYAAYHLCLLVRAKIPYATESRQGTHAAVIQALTNYSGGTPQFQEKVRALGRVLNQCKAGRVRADYDLDDSFNERDAQTMLERARRIEQRVIELLRQ